MTDDITAKPLLTEREDDLPQRFSLVAGGGFHAFLGRIGLLGDDMLPSSTAALGFALLAWSIPGVLALLQGQLVTGYSAWDYFQDPTVYTRYLIAIYMMIITERMADTRVTMLIQQFRDVQLLDGRGRAAFAAVVRQADERASSRLAEGLILVLAVAWSVTTTRVATVLSADSWEGVLIADGSTVLSWAGEVSAFSSNALFLFLVLRWFWRFSIWAVLLHKTASLELQIMPLHPDRCGGLGFLGIFPGIFTGLIFALSCVVAASFYKALPLIGDSTALVQMLLSAGGPLLVTAALQMPVGDLLKLILGVLF